MIELPATPAPNGISPTLLDYGFTQRGASSLRVDRAGSRYRFEVSYPPMPADRAREFTSRLQRAKSEGLQIDIPLLGVSQGLPGAPVVNGAGQAGKVLALRGLTPGYIAKSGFWLTVVEADGTAYLHSVAQTAVADAIGLASVDIVPPLRAPFADGDRVELARPFVQGFLDGDEWGWAVPINRLIAVGFMLEEFK
ncbi:hypothetical protein HME9302_00007 [Alteripontixanthobacter maritimus]|uniref:Uncharacterized protein n=1 Tax=Alteripontixanthobacter maritimus TaxID=2161824 RepID=A0A369QTB1_9SPHN|nr:hypothetical protein [Alteripontixanthobacter maritimus]RDC59791.1 hypothetical protein HME9302_00986 [Alteripontixanthobacter maritimus]RDC66556.1 hypothetical protein HME9302_00007 [Alteripontixanthobacter maritimus]